MQQYAINIDEILFKGKNTDQNRKKQKHRHKPIIHQKEDLYGLRLIEVDRVKIRGNCYNYGKEGHRAKDCRSKGKEPQKIRAIEQQATPDENKTKWL